MLSLKSKPQISEILSHKNGRQLLRNDTQCWPLAFRHMCACRDTHRHIKKKEKYKQETKSHKGSTYTWCLLVGSTQKLSPKLLQFKIALSMTFLSIKYLVISETESGSLQYHCTFLSTKSHHLRVNFCHLAEWMDDVRYQVSQSNLLSPVLTLPLLRLIAEENIWKTGKEVGGESRHFGDRGRKISTSSKPA